jgi:hypothetical protein
LEFVTLFRGPVTFGPFIGQTDDGVIPHFTGIARWKGITKGHSQRGYSFCFFAGFTLAAAATVAMPVTPLDSDAIGSLQHITTRHRIDR